jgi:hypothetical protein
MMNYVKKGHVESGSGFRYRYGYLPYLVLPALHLPEIFCPPQAWDAVHASYSTNCSVISYDEVQ